MGVHLAAHGGLVNVLRAQFALRNLFRQGAGRPHDFRPAAVIHGHVQGHAGVVGGFLLNLIHQFLVARLQRCAVAQKHHPVVLFFVVEGLDKVFAEQAHNRPHLFDRAAPVFGGESVKIHRFYADLIAIAGDVLKDLRTFFVAGGAGQTPLFCPAAVAVHNNADTQALSELFRLCHTDLLLSARAAARPGLCAHLCCSAAFFAALRTHKRPAAARAKCAGPPPAAVCHITKSGPFIRPP